MKKQYKPINGFDPLRGSWRKVDYLIKGFPTGLQQQIGRKLGWDSYPFLEELAEKEKGNPKLWETGFDEAEIAAIKEEAAAYFRDLNAMMTENGRYPFFPDPEDTARSAQTYFDLVERRPYPEIVRFFQCEFPDYKPAKLNNGTFKLKNDQETYQYQGVTYVFASEEDSVILHRIWERWNKVVTLHHAELTGPTSLRSTAGKTYDEAALAELLSVAIDNKQHEIYL